MKTVEEQLQFVIDSVNEYFSLKEAATRIENNHGDLAVRMGIEGTMSGIKRTLEWFGIDVNGNK